MSINSVTAMDVDSPSGGSSLKRSSSAPMINDINNTTMTTSSSTNSSPRDSSNFNIFSNVQPRTRRFSTSFSPVPGSPGPGPRLTPRISQIRQEECVDEVSRENTFTSYMKMSQSCEDLTLMNESPPCNKNDSEMKNAKDCKMMPLHLNLGSYQSLCSSPSPTRPGFTPYSPAGVQMWKTTLSPSPNRKQTYLTRRSLSPIAMRQSPLGSVKRKLDDDKLDVYASPRAKRLNSGGGGGGTICGGLLMQHAASASPLPGSLSSVGTPESLSSADSPGFTFRPVDSPSPSRQASHQQPPPGAVTDEPMDSPQHGIQHQSPS